MKRSALITLGAIGVLALVACSTSHAQLAPYSQDFEALTSADPNALGDDGWLVNGLLFDGSGGFKKFYGNFSAPNGGPSFSAIATGEGGVAQGSQYINTYSDYNCCDPGTTNEGHFNGTDIVENRIFQEQIVATNNIGNTVDFRFDAKLPSVEAGTALAPPATGGAFLRTLDPNNDFSTSAEVTLDALTLSNNEWSTHTLSLPITNALDGHFLQFGFVNVSSNFSNTGVFYDNINVSVPEPSTITLAVLGAVAFTGACYRRRCNL